MALQLLPPMLLPGLLWTHDQGTSPKIKGVERREVRLPIQNFTLTDQRGRRFDFQSLRGKVAIVTFAYTTCPDICPLITATMLQVQESLTDEERRAVYFVTVTTDPEIDTPMALSAYAKRYAVDPANWAFLTGEEPALKKVWQNFGVGVRRKARGLVDHTTLSAIVDRNGNMRVAYTGAPPEARAFLQDVRKLMLTK
jgi:protein SCO1/2